jgi:hypothetical protein
LSVGVAVSASDAAADSTETAGKTVALSLVFQLLVALPLTTGIDASTPIRRNAYVTAAPSTVTTNSPVTNAAETGSPWA